jgi:small-conductance mechanosensitive channel
MMNDKKLYQERKQAQIDEYELKLKELKDQLTEFDADTNRKLDEQIKIVESKLEEGKARLEAIIKASKEEFEAHKKAIDDTFMSINTHLSMC